MVDAGNGGDAVRIDEDNGVFSDTIPTTIEGGNGNDRLVGGAGAVTIDGGNGDDTLFGGNGNEKLLGGNGNDSIDGNKGNDSAFLGNGNDTFIWDPGDGSDTIEGENGNDTMVFNGANVVDTVDLVADGSHLKFFRQPANITMDTHGVERVDFNALGLADVVTVNDLTGTGVKELNVDLAGSLGGTTGDAAADRVIVNATNGDDKVDVSGNAGGVKVRGLVPTVRVLHSETANDSLEINTLEGTDTVKSAHLDLGLIQLFVDGALVPVDQPRPTGTSGPPSWGPRDRAVTKANIGLKEAARGRFERAAECRLACVPARDQPGCRPPSGRARRLEAERDELIESPDPRLVLRLGRLRLEFRLDPLLSLPCHAHYRPAGTRLGMRRAAHLNRRKTQCERRLRPAASAH